VLAGKFGNNVKMTQLIEPIALVTLPFFVGIGVGYSLRADLSFSRRSKVHR
jgi:hypothetical protein